MTGQVRILILEDRPTDAELVIRELRKKGISFTAECVSNEVDFLAQLHDHPPGLILADYALPTYDGLSALTAAKRHCPETPFIFVSGSLGEETAIEALHRGATDYVVKDRLSRLGPAVRRAVREIEERAQRRQTEQALRASERNYQEIFNAAHDAIFVHDAGTGAILDVNQRAVDMFGYSREELLSPGGETCPADGPFSYQEALRRIRLAITEGPQVFDWQSTRKNGEVFWTEVALRGTSIGGQGRVLAVVRDVSERKLADRVLAQSRRWQKALLDNIPDPAWFKDAQGRFLACNQPLLRLYRKKMEDVIGKTVFDTVPASAERMAREDQEVIATGKPLRVDLPVLDAAGKTRWFELTKSPVFNEQREVTGIVGIARETTGWRLNEERIQELNRLLRAIRDINKLIVQEREPQQLLAKACNILVQTRGYLLAWIGLPEPGSKWIIPAASAGKQADYLNGITVTWDETPAGQGPGGTALRTGQPCVCQDIATDPRFEPWRERALASGCVAVAAVPMLRAAKVIGVVSVYSDRKGAYSEEEVALLGELASDLAFALLSMEDERERRRAERRITAFSYVGQRLSVATTAPEAAQIISDVADQLLGWDACSFDLYSPETDRIHHVFSKDLVEGRRVDCAPLGDGEAPSPRARLAIEQGAQLILKDDPATTAPTGVSFGDTARPSACAIFAPVRNGTKVIGVLSLHSYSPKAYDGQSLATVQALADHCGGAMDRIRSEEALTESEENNRALVELSPYAIFLHSDGRFVYANPAALKLLGADQPQQLLGRPVLELVPPENREAVRMRIRLASERGIAPRLEQKILRLDGTAVEVEATSIRFTYRGRPAVQTVMRDVTERNQLEAQLRQAQKMEAVGQLAGGVAHDFNNMLAVIRGNAELLLLHPDQHTADTRDCLKQITAASERAANLTRQLLAFSRKQVMQSRPLILNEVITDLTKMLKQIIGEHIDLQCRYAADLPFVRADPGMIEQVLVNLAINARDAMPHGGQLVIATEAIHFDEAHPHTHPDARAGQFVCLTVRDAGTGIAPEHLPRIFEPFFTTKAFGKGTGLGLATVYGIVQQHQGWIEVFSQPGVGATFKILLPGVPPPAFTATAPPTETSRPGGNETILLVEDDFAVRTITRRVLESHGYSIYEATTAREALDVWRGCAEEIALLLTDIVMPEGITGRDLAEQLRAIKPTLKIILMSGYSAEVVGNDTSYFRRSKSYFLQKPCSVQILLETVRACLDANM